MQDFIDEYNIINKEYYEGVKEIVNCLICFNIIENPLQCDQCQNCFCAKCTRHLKGCPLRCDQSKFIPSFICKKLLSQIKIKCKCGEELLYDNFNDHIFKKCNSEKTKVDKIKSFRILEKGDKINFDTYRTIVCLANEEMEKKGNETLSELTRKKIEEKLGGKWFVLCCIEGLRGYDFMVSRSTIGENVRFILKGKMFLIIKMGE